MKKLLWLLGIFALISPTFTVAQGPKGQRPQQPKSQALPELFITCNPDSFQLICQRFEEDIYVLASLRIGKQVWKGVRLRLRGDTSREFAKKSMKLKLPDSKKLPFGRNTLNLNAEYNDKTYMRQYLCTRLFRDAGQPCYATEHLKVNLNGVFMGIYLLVENVDDDFLEKWGMSKKGDLFKATRDGACLSHYDDVKALWERKAPKKDTTWTVLQSLIAQLDTTPDAAYGAMAHSLFNYKNMVNSIAMNMLIGNRSTYYHNYFIYCSPEQRQWHWFPWDMDNTFISTEVHDLYQRGNNSDSYWGDMPSNPFFERALVTPEILHDIAVRIDNLAATVYNPAYLFPIIDSLALQLAPAIVGDTLFQTHTLASWHSEIDLLKAYIRERPDALRNQFLYNPTSFRLIQPKAPLAAGDQLRWCPAIDPNEDPISYRFSYSLDDHFPSGKTVTFKDIKVTSFILPADLAPGTYFWRVYATDGTQEIRGFDNRATFVVQAK